MKKLLLLHNRYDYSTCDIEKAAKARDWRVERIDDFNARGIIGDNKNVYYYGNTIQFPRIVNQLPITYYPLYENLLSNNKHIAKRKVQTLNFDQLGQPFKYSFFCKPFGDKFFEARIYQVGESIQLDHPEFLPFAGHELDYI